MEKKYYAQIDALKGIAIFFVVLAHSIILYPVNLMENEKCYFLFQLVSSVHMTLFFTVSGYCFSYDGSYKDYIFKKTKRILVPYVVFNLMDMVPRCLFPGFVNRSKSIEESLLDMLLCGGEYWFLYTLFFIFLLYPILYKIQKRSTLAKIIVEVCLLIIGFFPIPIEIFTINQVCKFLVFFNMGMLIKECGLMVFEWRFPQKWMFWGSIGGLGLMWVVLLLHFEWWLSMLTSFVGMLTIYLLMHWNQFVKCFARFGQYSLQLYLLNGFLLVISRTIICKLTVNPTAIIGFNMLIDFALSYLLIKYICTKIKPVRFLMGM
ncbi:MAG: acyltransferase [Lachnospiraceae bacterium]|nr:acyltransferase [Lachnospiraceae bacterium]